MPNRQKRLRHHDVLDDPYLHSQALLTTLCGSQIQILDQKLTFLSVLTEDKVGVWTFEALWAETPIAVKCALAPLLFSETAIHQSIQAKCQVPSHFPRCFFNVTTPDSLQILGFERLSGVSLDVAFPLLGDPTEAIASVGLQILDILEDLHLNCNIVHTNISPFNLIYRDVDPSQSSLCLTDFSLASHTVRQISSPIGSKLFASLAAHQVGGQISYISDIESLVYLLEWLVASSLPWKLEDEWDTIEAKKQEFIPEHCALPCICNLLTYVCSFSSQSDPPDYSALRSFFKQPDSSDEYSSEDDFVLPISLEME